MLIDAQTGLLDIAQYIPSPNYDERPYGVEIDLLVIHNISLPHGVFGGSHIIDLFCNKLDPIAHPSFAVIAGLRVAAHLLICRNGGVIQFVPFHKRAWHAGVSTFHGRANCNDFSIGIELEGCDDVSYEEAQYQQLAAITKLLQQIYPKITQENIVGHSDIAPIRKTDPGKAFDWERYRRLFINLQSL